jgi:hypothetical protein
MALRASSFHSIEPKLWLLMARSGGSSRAHMSARIDEKPRLGKAPGLMTDIESH